MKNKSFNVNNSYQNNEVLTEFYSVSPTTIEAEDTAVSRTVSTLMELVVLEGLLAEPLSYLLNHFRSRKVYNLLTTGPSSFGHYGGGYDLGTVSTPRLL